MSFQMFPGISMEIFHQQLVFIKPISILPTRLSWNFSKSSIGDSPRYCFWNSSGVFFRDSYWSCSKISPEIPSRIPSGVPKKNSSWDYLKTFTKFPSGVPAEIFQRILSDFLLRNPSGEEYHKAEKKTIQVRLWFVQKFILGFLKEFLLGFQQEH